MPSPPVPAAEASRQRAQRARLRRWVMGVVFGVPLALLACALYLLLGPKPPPPPAALPVSAAQAAQAEQNIAAVRQALTAPETVASAPPNADAAPNASPAGGGRVQRRRGPDGKDVYTLQVSQADLNAYFSNDQKLKQTLEAKGVHAVSVELRAPANVIVHANATLRGVTDNALVAAALTPDPLTGLRLNISDARFGRLPPPIVQAAAARVASQVVGRAKTALPLTVQKVEVKGTDLILTGIRRDAAPPKS